MILSKEWKDSIHNSNKDSIHNSSNEIKEPEQYASSSFSNNGQRNTETFEKNFELDDNTDISHSGPVSVSLNFRSEEESMFIMSGNRLSHRPGTSFSPHSDRSSDNKKGSRRSFLHRTRFSADSMRKLRLPSLHGRFRIRSVIFYTLLVAIFTLAFLKFSSVSLFGSSIPITTQKDELREKSELKVNVNTVSVSETSNSHSIKDNAKDKIKSNIDGDTSSSSSSTTSTSTSTSTSSSTTSTSSSTTSTSTSNHQQGVDQSDASLIDTEDQDDAVGTTLHQKIETIGKENSENNENAEDEKKNENNEKDVDDEDNAKRVDDSQFREKSIDANSESRLNSSVSESNSTTVNDLEAAIVEKEMLNLIQLNSEKNNSASQTEPQTESQAESQAESQIEFQTESQTKSQIESEAESQIESQTESLTKSLTDFTHSKLNLHSDSDSNLNSSLQNLTSSLNSKEKLIFNSNSNSNSNSNPDSDSKADSDSNSNSSLTLMSNHQVNETNSNLYENDNSSQYSNSSENSLKMPYDSDIYEKLFSPPKFKGYKQCIDRSKHTRGPPEFPHGYLLITANGGLNQMRTAICDMVAIARLMKVALVIPYLDHTSFWADPSEFGDIFDVDHFINELKDDVTIIKSLDYPFNQVKAYEKNPISWSNDVYYKTEIVPLMKKYKVIHFVTTDTRLANNNLPFSLQRLRCRTNFRALKFTPQINQVSDSIARRLRQKGPYIALHLRYEKDMLAFTGCDKGLTDSEAEELKSLRYGFSRWKEKEINGGERRRQGLCPLTPRETSLLLQALGYPNNTIIYIAAGEIYGSTGLKEFTSYYPFVYSHESLATEEELASLGNYQNRLAAIDYTISTQSDVFIFTYDGNMARTVQGYRRYMGHMRTILPDRKAVVKLVDKLDAGKTSMKSFSKAIRRVHKHRNGVPRTRNIYPMNPKSEDYFYANPFPECICESRFARKKRIASEADA